jgi:hypothetical protein
LVLSISLQPSDMVQRSTIPSNSSWSFGWPFPRQVELRSCSDPSFSRSSRDSSLTLALRLPISAPRLMPLASRCEKDEPSDNEIEPEDDHAPTRPFPQPGIVAQGGALTWNADFDVVMGSRCAGEQCGATRLGAMGLCLMLIDCFLDPVQQQQQQQQPMAMLHPCNDS